jgi:cold-inducible RNA-binding protein
MNFVRPGGIFSKSLSANSLILDPSTKHGVSPAGSAKINRRLNRRRKGETESMGKKLFVGGLSWDTTDDGLRQAFQPFGEITEAKVITDRDTGRSRGFGFVTFNGDEEAKAAIAKMDGTVLDGKTIKVNEAQEKSPRGGGRPGGGFGGGRGGGGGRNRW